MEQQENRISKELCNCMNAAVLNEFPTEPIIRGENLILRPMVLEDTQRFLQMRNHPDVQKWFIYRKEITEAEHISWMNKHLTKDGDSRQFMICAPQEDGLTYAVIGCTNLKNIDFVNKRSEYGLFIADPNMRGKGYGLETQTLMSRYAFDVLGLNSIFGRILVNNVSSYSTVESGGFHLLKIEKDVVATDGTVSDMYLVELCK